MITAVFSACGLKGNLTLNLLMLCSYEQLQSCYFDNCSEMSLDFRQTYFLATRNKSSVVQLGVEKLEIIQNSCEFGLFCPYYKNYNTTCDIKTSVCARIIFSCDEN